MFLQFGPKEIKLGGKTGAGSNGDSGDGDLCDGGGDGTMYGGGFGGGGDDIIGGEKSGSSDLVKQTAKSRTVRFEGSESAKKWRIVLSC